MNHKHSILFYLYIYINQIHVKLFSSGRRLTTNYRFNPPSFKEVKNKDFTGVTIIKIYIKNILTFDDFVVKNIII
jgi:hypothetical protein